MNRLSVSLALLLVMLPGLTRPAPGQDTLPDLLERIQPSVVILKTYDAMNRLTGTATGFFIDESRIVATRHSVEQASHVAVFFPDGARYHIGRIIAEDIEGDLVLLEVDDLDRVVVGLTYDAIPPRNGEDVFVVGFPLGLKQTTSQGIVSGRNPKNHEFDFIQISAPISLGSSGSPVLNMQGKVIGIAAARIPEGEDLNLAIPAERLRHFLLDPMPFKEWAQLQLLRQKDDEHAHRNNRIGIPAIFPIEIPESVALMADGVVSVVAFDEQDEEMHRSDGFFITPTQVLTLRTAVQDAHHVMIQAMDGQEFVVDRVAGDDPLGGLLLLDVEIDFFVPVILKLGWHRPYREEPLIVVSSSEKAQPKFTQLRTTLTMTNLPGYGHALSVGSLDMLSRAGSPVVSVGGQVLGIVNERWIEDMPLRFLTPADRIRTHLFDRPVALRQWIKKNATDPVALTESPLWQAIPFIFTDRWSVASTILEHEITIESTDADRWLAIAMCRNSLGDWPEVIDAANHALNLRPDSSLACFLQAAGFSNQITRDPMMALKLASEACRKAIALDPTFNFHSYIKLAAILGDIGELEQAVNLMMETVIRWPDRPETHHMLSSVSMHYYTKLVNDHQFGPSRRYLERSMEEAIQTIQLAPFASWAHRQFAQCATLNESFETAIVAAKKAVALAPEDPLALDTLGRVYLLSGDTEASLETYRALLELDEAAAEALRLIITSREEP